MGSKGGRNGPPAAAGASGLLAGARRSNGGQDEKSARLAAQLRANLKRRKAAERARDAVCDPPGHDHLPQAGDEDRD